VTYVYGPTPWQRPSSLTGLTLVVAIALAACAALDLAVIYAELSYRHVLSETLANGYPPVNAGSIDHRRHQYVEVVTLASVFTWVLFIAWFSTAYTNLGRIGISGLRFGPGWAIGAWFVPFLNLVRPKAIANDIWRGSNPELPKDSALPRGSVPWYFGLWWIVWIASGIVSGIGAVTFRDANGLSAERSSITFIIVGYALSAVAGLLAILVVTKTAGRQTARSSAFLEPPRAVPVPELAEVAARPDLDALATPGGTPCPACGFENHPLAPFCLRCHKALSR
jgi:hypothetical protein